jgi:hypothetical protein
MGIGIAFGWFVQKSSHHTEKKNNLSGYNFEIYTSAVVHNFDKNKYWGYMPPWA